MTVVEKTMGQMLDELGLETGRTMAEKTIEFYGVEKKAYEVIHKIESLIKTETDFHDLGADILEEGHIFFALCKYQKRKLAENQMTEEEFLNNFESDPIPALERLFQENVREWWFKSMQKKNISPNYIYEQFQQGCRKFMGAVLSYN